MSLTRLLRTQGLRTIIWLCVIAAVGQRWFNHVQAADTHLGFDVANASVPLAANRSVTITGKDGNVIPSTTAYWFAWHAFYPDSSVYRHSH
jgi:hypothetical protein